METTNYKGVNYKTSQRKWVASLGWKGENISCGSWKTEIEAVRARDKVIIRMGLPIHKLQIFKKVTE
jgi:hypothetical protein